MKIDRVAVGQINTTIGDFEQNVTKIIDCANDARSRGADLICFPELAVCGYPPRDLLERPSFIQENESAVEQIQSEVNDISVLVGYAASNPDPVGKSCFNSAALISEGSLSSVHHKTLLPTYDVFNEPRYFQPADGYTIPDIEPRSGITICEDIWNDPEFSGSFDQPRYPQNPLEDLIRDEIQLLFNLSASPFIKGKDRFRIAMLKRLAEKYDVYLVLANLVGGNDSLIFDGNSLIVGPDGRIIQKADSFETDMIVADLDQSKSTRINLDSEIKTVYRGLTIGLQDYLDKCGFSKALLGLSGGIDSSLTAAIAADTLGPENVFGVLMPSQVSSSESVEHANMLAENLGIDTRTFRIADLFNGYMDLLDDEFKGLEWDHTEENLQARIRGNLLMALSNKYGWILLSTGNKSELAVGYCTLYGDMNGGLAVISDVPKTMVYELAEYRNSIERVIPQAVIDKPPSAELAPDQTDQDDLPPYEVLDRIIELYVEDRKSRQFMIESGLDADIVNEVVRKIDLNEYKRQQAAIGLKVTSKSFGVGREMPIAQHFDK